MRSILLRRFTSEFDKVPDGFCISEDWHDLLFIGGGLSTALTPKQIRIEKLKAEGDLGLSNGSIELKPHHPRWKRLFSDEAYAIFDALRIDDLRLYHIGSTSIPNIHAKPVLDILGSVRSIAFIDAEQSTLEQLGYTCKGEYGIEGRRYCVLYDESNTSAYVHLHIFEHSSPHIASHLLFRDHLRANSDSARFYENAKLDLLASGASRADYPTLKGITVKGLLDEAKDKAKPIERVLAILGTADGGANTRSVLNDFLSRFDNHETVNLNEVLVAPFVYDRSKHSSADVFFGLVEKMIAADRIVLATPVYWYAMSGPMKDFIDRFSDLLSGPLKAKAEMLYGKKIQILATGYDQALPMGFEVPFAGTAIYFGLDYMGATYRSIR